MTTLYTASWVLPVASPPIQKGAVAIHNGIIIAVGSEEKVREQLSQKSSFDIVNLGEAIICPGFVNVHTHLELTVLRGFLENLHFHEWIGKLTKSKYEQLSFSDLQISAQCGAIEAIKAGITTIGDTGDAGITLDTLLASGQRGIVFQEIFGIDMLEAKKNLKDLKEKVATLKEKETSLIKVGISPHSPYTVSTLLFRLVTEYADEEKLFVCIHTAESQAEEDFIYQGLGPITDSLRKRGIKWNPPRVSTIRYLSDLNVLRVKPLLVHCVRATEEDIGLLALWGAKVAHCPKSNSKLGHGIAPALQMRKRGVLVGLGTDSVASNNVCDLLDEARFCGLLHRASHGDGQLLPASELLEWMTIGGARALGLDGCIGTLEVGKDADLVAVSLDKLHLQPTYDPVVALIASATAQDVILTMVKGKVLYDGETVLTLNESSLRKSLREIKLV